MSDATPLFLITDAGLAAASVATPTGPYIHITGFQIGSAYGYTPQRSDTGLNGNLLYSGVPTSYSNIGNNTLDIICEIPPDAGPFDFGEVALFLDGGVMFAKAVFSTPQTKYSSLGTNVVSSYTFHCLLKLQQSTAVFQINTLNGPPAVWDVYAWSDVYPPGISANPDIPLTLVRELNVRGDSSLLQNTNDAQWTLGTSYWTYSPAGTNGTYFPVANSSTSWIEVAASLCHPSDLGQQNRQFVIRTPDGFYRSVQSVVQSGSNYRFNLNVTNDGTYNNSPLLTAPAVGSGIRIYRDDQMGGSIYYSQLVDPPPPPNLATYGNPGLAYGGQGLYMPQPGVIQAFGMLQSPSSNTGRILTGGDNLNNFGLNSGLYITYSASYGFPANMPVAYDCQIWVHNNGNDITQLAFPMNGGGGDGAGNNGYPPYWRQGYSGGAWTNWFPLAAKGKVGTSTGAAIYFAQGNINGSAVWNGASAPLGLPALTSAGILHTWLVDDSANTTNMYRNGQNTSQNTKNGGAGYGRRHHDHAYFQAGDTVQFNVSGNPVVACTMMLFQ